MVKAGVVAVLLLLLAGDGSAQIVRGTVADDSNNAPLHGVFIALIDSTGNTRGGTLSDTKGFYAIRAPYSGTFSLRAERIGFRSVTTRAFALTDGTAHTVDIRVGVAAIALAPIDVRGTKRCEVRREQGRRTAQLWEEARKALTVAGIAEKEKWIRYESRSWTRELDPYSLEVRLESARYGIYGSSPYRAVSVDSLAKFGFVQNFGDDVIYYGPDADVLLSDVFLAQHCFRSVVGSGETEGMIGLAFEPVRTQTQRDIEGALWMDAKSLELRFIEYRYTGMPRTYNVKTLGGRTDFRRLPNGAWLIDRWYIRMPKTAISAGRGNIRLTALQEEGGEIVSIRDDRTSVRLMAEGTVAGTVYDSVHHRPLANAMVYLSGTSYRANTDSIGRFVMDDVPVGRYVATFTHASLDSVPTLPTPASVDVLRDDTTTIGLSIAAAETQIRAQCGGVSTGATLFGRITNRAGGAVPDAEVIARVEQYVRPAGGRIEVYTNNVSVTSDRAGYYFLCSLPVDSRITIRVKAGGDAGARTTTSPGEKNFRRLDIEVKE